MISAVESMKELEAMILSRGLKPDAELLAVCAIAILKERAEIERLRDIIRRASVKFCEDGADGAIAAAMFTILGEVNRRFGVEGKK